MKKKHMKILSVLLALILALSSITVLPLSAAAAEAEEPAQTGDSPYSGLTLDSGKLYFDAASAGWSYGSKDKVAFLIQDDQGGEVTPYLGTKAIGTAVAGADGIFEYDVAAKMGVTLTPGVQYEVWFYSTSGKIWGASTYPMYFTTDCLGHVAYCTGANIEYNSFGNSVHGEAACFDGIDPTVCGPVLAISDNGNVVGECLTAGKTAYDIFVDYISVIDDNYGMTRLDYSRTNVIELGEKTEQELIDDIAYGLGLTTEDVSRAFSETGVETTWSPDPELPAEPFEYAVYDSHYAAITKYNWKEAIVEVPSEIDGNTVETIENGAFKNNTAVTKVILPDTLKSIGLYVFQGCSSLAEINIPTSRIGDESFEGCTALTDIYVNRDVELDKHIFGYGALPENLTIHGYTNSGAEVFAKENIIPFVSIGEIPESDYYRYSINNGKATLCKYSGYQKIIEIPDTYEGCPVTAIEMGAFNNNTNIVEVTLPESVTEIRSQNINIDMDRTLGAFEGCSSLKKINIPDGVTVITSRTFNGCSSLEEIEIPDTVTSIGDVAFEGCSSLESIDIPDSVTSIGVSAFGNCTGLTSVKLPDSITSISAFNNCSSLKSIEIPDSVTVIGGGAFRGCGSLTEITIPENVTKIGYRAIDNCDNLKTLHFNAADCTITGSWENGYLFFNGIETLTIGPAVSKLQYMDKEYGTSGRSFSFPDLKSVSVDKDNPVFDSRDNCNAVIETATNTLFIASENTVIPDTVTSISYSASEATVAIAGAFSCLNHLDKVTIPASVESIGYSAFKTSRALTIYGYEGSAAQTYADKFENFTFVPLTTVIDESGVTADVTNGVTLDVENITDTFDGSVLPEGTILVAAYDIRLVQDGEEVQPENVVTVKIPCDDPDTKVYHQEADGTLTDMKADYRDGYLVFKTSHLSTYIVATGAQVAPAICGDADGDGEITALDATTIQRYNAKIATDIPVEMLMYGDVNGDGEADIIDVTLIQRYLAKMNVDYPIGETLC